MPKYLDQDGVAYLWQKINNNLNDKIDYYSKKKSEWDSEINFISQKNVLYIYEDYKIIYKDDEQIFLPGLKVGDGKTYLIDLPFIGGNNDQFESKLLDHINNNIIHVSLEEKNFWNNKLNYSEIVDKENLIFNRE